MIRATLLFLTVVYALSGAYGQEFSLGPPPKLPPPSDNLGELFPVEGETSETGELDLTPFPEVGEPVRKPLDWELLEPADPEFPNGTIIYQAPLSTPTATLPRETIETHDGTRDYSADSGGPPSWLLPAAGGLLLLLLSATGTAIWRGRTAKVD